MPRRQRASFDDMLKCRVYMHAWDEFYPDDLGTPIIGWRLSLRCTRCSTERHDLIGRTGALEGRRYIYPDDYKLARGETPTREQLRQTLFMNVRAKLMQANAVNELSMKEAG